MNFQVVKWEYHRHSKQRWCAFRSPECLNKQLIDITNLFMTGSDIYQVDDQISLPLHKRILLEWNLVTLFLNVYKVQYCLFSSNTVLNCLLCYDKFQCVVVLNTNVLPEQRKWMRHKKSCAWLFISQV